MHITNPGLCSFCCLGYNHGRFLEQSIRAIWECEYPNKEIIAVDDGSTDDSVASLQALAAESPCPMYVIHQENTGNIGMNFNRALKHAKGEFVLFQALDDVIIPGEIARKLALMEKDSRIAFIANSDVNGIDDKGDPVATLPILKLHSISSPTLELLNDLEYSEFGAFYLQGTALRRDVAQAFGGFDDDMTGDDIVFRTKLFRYLQSNPQYSFQIFNKPAFSYRLHDNNIHKNIARQIRIVTEYLERYWPNHENPKILREWFKYGIESLTLNEALNMLALNNRTLSLFLDEGTRNLFFRSQQREFVFARHERKKRWYHSIVMKERYPKGLRHITFFSRFVLTYVKKNR